MAKISAWVIGKYIGRILGRIEAYKQKMANYVQMRLFSVEIVQKHITRRRLESGQPFWLLTRLSWSKCQFWAILDCFVNLISWTNIFNGYRHPFFDR